MIKAPKHDIEAIPLCPYCNEPNPKWRKGLVDNIKMRKVCGHCKKRSDVWCYRVYVVQQVPTGD